MNLLLSFWFFNGLIDVSVFLFSERILVYLGMSGNI